MAFKLDLSNRRILNNRSQHSRFQQIFKDTRKSSLATTSHSRTQSRCWNMWYHCCFRFSQGLRNSVVESTSDYRSLAWFKWRTCCRLLLLSILVSCTDLSQRFRQLPVLRQRPHVNHAKVHKHPPCLIHLFPSRWLGFVSVVNPEIGPNIFSLHVSLRHLHGSISRSPPLRLLDHQETTLRCSSPI